MATAGDVLVRLGDKRAVDALLLALRNADDLIRRAAEAELRKLGYRR